MDATLFYPPRFLLGLDYLVGQFIYLFHALSQLYLSLFKAYEENRFSLLFIVLLLLNSPILFPIIAPMLWFRPSVLCNGFRWSCASKLSQSAAEFLGSSSPWISSAGESEYQGIF